MSNPYAACVIRSLKSLSQRSSIFASIFSCGTLMGYSIKKPAALSRRQSRRSGGSVLLGNSRHLPMKLDNFVPKIVVWAFSFTSINGRQMALSSLAKKCDATLRIPRIHHLLNYFCPVHALIISAKALINQAPLHLNF